MRVKIRTFRFIAAAAAAMMPCSAPALAGSQTGHAVATIAAAIQIIENTPMNFGLIVPPIAGGTVTVTPADVLSGAGFFFLGDNVAAEFTALGTPGQAATIGFGTGNTLSGPGATIALGTFTTDAGSVATFPPGGILNSMSEPISPSIRTRPPAAISVSTRPQSITEQLLAPEHSLAVAQGIPLRCR